MTQTQTQTQNTTRYFLDWEFHDDGCTIEPISLGIVAEDGRELYVELDYDKARVHADEWMLANVVPHLNGATVSAKLARGKLLAFVGNSTPEFWAYYADYDWVTTCHLFGTMMDLPARFPMLCMDLQQWWIQLGRPGGVKPPDPTDAHNALADARWNRDLHAALAAYQGPAPPAVLTDEPCRDVQALPSQRVVEMLAARIAGPGSADV